MLTSVIILAQTSIIQKTLLIDILTISTIRFDLFGQLINLLIYFKMAMYFAKKIVMDYEFGKLSALKVTF